MKLKHNANRATSPPSSCPEQEFIAGGEIANPASGHVFHTPPNQLFEWGGFTVQLENVAANGGMLVPTLRIMSISSVVDLMRAD